ncbi:metal-sensitive transcriptional regulator [Paenibacillus aquistagni]|uniref:DNA-binding transcriptional regulator, FrmR family n=1 Tax=Paenibacillus aquistagni TaxID=1852522 RepID=A0A1X7I9E4_9BACL|nr:metal-sensitive transcriptional regulator [Paenibacillus aquistagni]SMG11219.1 DNA-binding transcriptional regulator, FrmR family [Paenibacillus aquistagni]
MKYDHDVKMRLKRIEGQARGVLNMMEQEKHCKDVVSQLTAIRNAADRAIASIVAANLEKCILEDTGSSGASLDSSKYVKEAVDLLVKSR